jgi:hypothetical protein
MAAPSLSLHTQTQPGVQQVPMRLPGHGHIIRVITQKLVIVITMCGIGSHMSHWLVLDSAVALAPGQAIANMRQKTAHKDKDNKQKLRP